MSDVETYMERAERVVDSRTGEIAYVRVAATSDFWDQRWATQIERQDYSGPVPRGSVIVSRTRAFLPSGSRILEGGCGNAFHSWHLHQSGYEAWALDYAPETVERLQAAIPEVHPTLGDVRELPFDDGFFDGYWSLGVIEHYLDGFEPVRDEMARVLRPGGFAFVTFPVMNPIRQQVASRLPRHARPDPDRFYQYALYADRVEASFRAAGFVAVQRERSHALLGMQADVAWSRPLIHRLRQLKRGRFVRSGIERILRPLTGHIALLIMKKVR